MVEVDNIPLASYTLQIDDQFNISIHGMIDPEQRRKGFASPLAEQVLKLIKDRPILTGTRIDNLAARKVLEKNGFELLECSDGFASYKLK